MTSPTHLAFGLLYGTTVWAFGTRPLYHDPGAVAAVALGSLLPDLDTQQSLMGRLAPALSARLERRLSHRGATHSLVALLLAIALCLPLAWVRPAWYGAFLLGYTSHLMADGMTKSGIMLFYPLPARAAAPRSEKLRFDTGSTAERVLLAALLVLLALAVHLSSAGGVWRVLRYLSATPAMAYRDFREVEGDAWLDFQGRWRDTRQPVAGAGLILEGRSDGFVLWWQGKVVTYGEHDQIMPGRTRVRAAGRPLRLDTVQVHRQTLTQALSAVPDDALLKGRLESEEEFVVTGHAVDEVPPGASSGQQPRIEGQVLECSWIPRRALARLRPRRRVDPQYLAQASAQVAQTRLDLVLLQLQRPPAHYLTVEAARTRLDAQERVLAALQDSVVRFTGALFARHVGEEP